VTCVGQNALPEPFATAALSGESCPDTIEQHSHSPKSHSWLQRPPAPQKEDEFSPKATLLKRGKENRTQQASLPPSSQWRRKPPSLALHLQGEHGSHAARTPMHTHSPPLQEVLLLPAAGGCDICPHENPWLLLLPTLGARAGPLQAAPTSQGCSGLLLSVMLGMEARSRHGRPALAMS
jgi:hypothetical protein